MINSEHHRSYAEAIADLRKKGDLLRTEAQECEAKAEKLRSVAESNDLLIEQLESNIKLLDSKLSMQTVVNGSRNSYFDAHESSEGGQITESGEPVSEKPASDSSTEFASILIDKAIEIILSRHPDGLKSSQIAVELAAGGRDVSKRNVAARVSSNPAFKKVNISSEFEPHQFVWVLSESKILSEDNDNKPATENYVEEVSSTTLP